MLSEHPQTEPCDPPPFDADDEEPTLVRIRGTTSYPCTPPPPSSDGEQLRQTEAGHALSDLLLAGTRADQTTDSINRLLANLGEGTDDPAPILWEEPRWDETTLTGLGPVT